MANQSPGSWTLRSPSQYSGDVPTPGANRPGPRRATQPAATEQRERNRQAQRQHRERKEQYIKDLEREVARLRQYCIHVVKERNDVSERENALRRENYKLRAQLGDSQRQPYSTYKTYNFADERGSSASGSRRAASSSYTASPPELDFDDSSTPFGSDVNNIPPSLIGTLDYEAIGLDFVLALERPCIGHIQYLVQRATNTTGQVMRRPSEVPDDDINLDISGHALMASCPPPEFMIAHPSGTGKYALPSGVGKASLSTLLGLSNRIPDLATDELPPVKAWARIMSDPRFSRLSAENFRQLRKMLYSRVDCFRFGAVISASDLEHALARVCQQRSPY